MRSPHLDLARLAPGFEAPVEHAQACFRSVLEALARPGRIQTFDALPARPSGLGAAQAAILLTLADADTPVWLAPGLATQASADYLRFHCGCPLAAEAAEAAFIVCALSDLAAIQAFRLGEPEYPERSATLLIEVEALDADGPLRLTGPGIQHVQPLGIGGWAAGHTALVQANHARFPLGGDFIFCCEHRIAGIPRSTRIAQEGH